jgi:hypothetical protein
MESSEAADWLMRRFPVGSILRLRLNGRDIWFEPHIAQCALFLGFQLPNFFAKQVDVRQITHGKQLQWSAAPMIAGGSFAFPNMRFVGARAGQLPPHSRCPRSGNTTRRHSARTFGPDARREIENIDRLGAYVGLPCASCPANHRPSAGSRIPTMKNTGVAPYRSISGATSDTPTGCPI